MARPSQVSLDVDLVAPEECLCLTLCARHGIVNLIGRFDDFHATTAASVGRLNAHWPPELISERADVIRAFGEFCRARDDRRSAALSCDTRRHFVAHFVDGFSGWPNPCNTHRGDGPSKVSVF